MALFNYSPFWMVVICALTPLPFWPARILAIWRRYPLWRFMLATLVGRIPGFFVYAWFGELVAVPTWILVGVIVGPAAAVIVTRLVRGVPLLAETAPPAPDAVAFPVTAVAPVEPRARFVGLTATRSTED